MGEKWPTKFRQTIRLPRNCWVKTATWDRRLYFPSEGRHAEEFFARKIRRLRPGSNPLCWVPEASMLTTRPSKPLSSTLPLTSALDECRRSTPHYGRFTPGKDPVPIV
jgi:hypothetical protein